MALAVLRVAARYGARSAARIREEARALKQAMERAIRHYADITPRGMTREITLSAAFTAPRRRRHFLISPFRF